ncbi:MAG: hypothetical protein ACI4MH_06710 [Candidatus Coproplasma sp.]
MENNTSEDFNYTYSAEQQEEVKEILKKYAPPEEESDLQKLRRLDRSVTRKATVRAAILGAIGALLTGCGMSLAMSDLPKILSMDSTLAMVVGVIVGLIGIAAVCLVYPVYNLTVKSERKKIAPEVMSLTEKLLK